MFKNIGSKIKMLAKVTCWVGVIGSVLGGFVTFINAMDGEDSLIPIALAMLIAGPILSWVGSFITYGFGQLIENTDKLVAMKAAEVTAPASEQKEN